MITNSINFPTATNRIRSISMISRILNLDVILTISLTNSLRFQFRQWYKQKANQIQINKRNLNTKRRLLCLRQTFQLSIWLRKSKETSNFKRSWGQSPIIILHWQYLKTETIKNPNPFRIWNRFLIEWAQMKERHSQLNFMLTSKYKKYRCFQGRPDKSQTVGITR